MSLQDKIAKAKAQVESAEPTPLNIEVGGELTALTFLPVYGDVWSDITAENPPRPGATLDSNVGYNTDGAAKSYPRDRITVDGEAPRYELSEEGKVVVDEWRDLLSVLSSPNLKNIASTLWGLNQLDAARRLAEAGKASKG